MGSKTEMDRTMQALHEALKREFPSDTVDVTGSAVADNIHVLIVSRRFDGLSPAEKQDLVWDALDKLELDEEEISRISLLHLLSPGELI